MERRRVLMLADAQNLFYSLRDSYGSEARVDFLKLREIVCRRAKGTSIKSVIYFTTLREDLSGLVEFLVCNGFDVSMKYMEDKYKGDVDSSIIVDALSCADDFDVFVICSGDSDYIPLIENLLQKGKEVGVVSFERTTARKLEAYPNWIVYLDGRIILKMNVPQEQS